MAADEEDFVVLLIGELVLCDCRHSTTKQCRASQILTKSLDEVESLTAARAGAMSGTEPSDALRVSHVAFRVDIRKPNALSGCERAPHADRPIKTSEKRTHHGYE